MSINRKIDRREGNVSEETRFGTLSHSEEIVQNSCVNGVNAHEGPQVTSLRCPSNNIGTDVEGKWGELVGHGNIHGSKLEKG